MKKFLSNNQKGILRDSVAAVFYAFRQVTKFLFPSKWENAANLDPFYLCGIASIAKSLKSHKRRFLLLLPIILYALLQALILQDVDIVRMIVNIAKIILCIFAMFYVKDNWKKFSIFRIVQYATYLIFAVTVIALFFRQSSFLWRLGDLFNNYSSIRLHGLFFEPSELGFHVMILIIFLIGFFASAKFAKTRRKIVLLIAMNMVSLFLSQPFGAIVVGAIAIIVFVTVKVFKNLTKKKLGIYLIAIASSVVLVVLSFTLKSPIAMRLIDTFNGSDASNNYRIEVSLNVMAESLKETNGLGVGFGNLNTAAFKESYSYLGLATVVANSFQYYIIEGGVFAIATLLMLWLWIMSRSGKNFTALKIALLAFLFLYQVFGGHFTSGLTWALYGLCVSAFDENEEMKIIEGGKK